MSWHWLLYVAVMVSAGLISSTCGQQSLDKDGINVCSRTFKYKTYYQTTASYTSYENYRTCCKKFIWCTSRCTKYRTKTRVYTKSALREREMTSFFCCPGYARQGNACPRAICTPPCENGDCIAPNQCRCKDGFSGKQCETEINECQASTKPCQQVCTNLRGSYACSCLRGYRKKGTAALDSHCENVNECQASNYLCKCAIANAKCKATCMDTIGSYRCQCSAGFRLINNKICTDENECKAGNHNCEQKCINTGGGFTCDCDVGYWLRGDGRTCYDLNECRSANGGCEQICTNTKGSYQCSCRPGFILTYDKVRCQDIDECITTRPCDHYHGSCQNTYGAYKCLCDRGYEMQDDRKTCKDINECKREHGCQQNCHNTDGSYFCSCLLGFRLSRDKRNCVDIDECKEGLHNCEQDCQNVAGSFACSCRSGFFLHSDKKTCKPFPCKTLYNPRHGHINCTGVNVGDVCQFGCNSGYEVDGNALRICLPTSRWTLDEPKCVPQKCPAARPPVHGSLVLPCVERYDSRCIVKCHSGYQLQGSHTTKCILKNKRTQWDTNTTSTCQEIKLCNPNPCLNGGKCGIVSSKLFQCDCANTGYQGDRCHVGMVTLPLFPQLTVDKMSETLVLQAKPQEELIVTPEANQDDIYFAPTQLVIKHPQTSVSFTVTANIIGLVRITYNLGGSDRVHFLQPQDSFLYVTSAQQQTRATIPDVDFAKKQCKTLNIDKCPSGHVVALASSCPWDGSGTKGYVSVQRGQLRVPLSLGGLQLPSSDLSQWNYRKNGVLSATQETRVLLTEGMSTCSSELGCPGTSYSAGEHKFVTERNLVSHAFYRALSSIAPWWFKASIADSYVGFDARNIQTLLLKTKAMSQLKSCASNFPTNLDGIMSVYSSRAPATVKMMSKAIHLESASLLCSAIDLCHLASYMSLPSDSMIELGSDFRSLGLAGIDISVSGVGLGSSAPIGNHCTDYLDPMSGRMTLRCFSAAMWLKGTGNVKVPNVNASFRGEQWLESNSIEQMPIDRFSKKVKFVARGDVTVMATLQIAGSPLGVTLKDNEASLFGSVGGSSSDRCSLCDGDDFLTIDVNPQSTSFDYKTSAVTFRPSPYIVDKKTFQLRLHRSLTGGQVIGVANAIELKLRYRLLSRSLPATLTGLVASLGMRRQQYPGEIAKLREFLTAVKPLLNRNLQLVSLASPDYKSVYEETTKLQNSIVIAKNVLKSLRDNFQLFETNIRMKSMVVARITAVIRFFKLLSGLRVTPATLPIADKFQGISMSYQGEVCFHSLCFAKSLVSVLDSSVADSDINNCRVCAGTSHFHKFDVDKTHVSVMQMQNRTLAGVLQLEEGSVVHGEVSKQADDFSISFPAKVSVFGRQTDVTFHGDSKTLKFASDNVKLPLDLVFDIEAKAQRTVATRWTHTRFDFTGQAAAKTNLTARFEKIATDYVRKVQMTTNERLSKSEEKLNRSILAVNHQSSIVAQYRIVLKAAEKAQHDAKVDALRARVQVNSSLHTFRSYLVGSSLQNMEKTLDSHCTYKTCNETCMSVASCSVCQEPIFIMADTLKCEQIDKKIRTTTVEPLKTDCALVQYRFTPIYTGTCRKGGGGKLTGALTSVGAGVGSLVGTFILPGIGTAVGGLIGSAVGFFAGLFSSCDESYEVYKEQFNYQTPCTRKQFHTSELQWVYTECYVKQEEVLSFYDVPKECDCNNDTCTIVQDPVCMQLNNECRKLRRIEARKIIQAAGTYNDSYEQLHRAEARLTDMQLRLDHAEKSLTVARRSYGRQMSLLKEAELTVRIENRTLQNSNVNLGVEKCLTKAGQRLKAFASIVKVSSVTFKSTNLINEDLLLDVEIRAADSIATKILPFLFVFDDPKLSVQQGVQRITRQLLCSPGRRKRRTVDVERVDDLIGLPSFIRDFDKEATHSNVSEAQAACLVSKAIFNYLRLALSDLHNRSMIAEQRQRKLIQFKNSMHSTLQRYKGVSDAAVLAQTKLVETVKSDAADSLTRLRPDNVIDDWLKAMELVTGANNFTGCLQSDDCLEKAFEDLNELPTMLTITRAKYIEAVHDLRQRFISLRDPKPSLRLLTADSASALQHLTTLMASTSFCAGVPRVALNVSDQVIALIGRTLTLECQAESYLPMHYTWKKDNVTLPGEHARTLTMDVVDDDQEGSYICEARNRVGRNASLEVFVMVQSSPTMVEQPRDVSYHDAMPSVMRPKLVCNVSAEPPANITWFHISFTSLQSRVIPGQVKPVLAIERLEPVDSGYYYCIADNGFGSVQSRKTRVDILRSDSPKQAITMSFDVEAGRGLSIDKKQYKDHVILLGKPTEEQRVNVSFEAKSSRKLNVAIELLDETSSSLSFATHVVKTDAERIASVSRSRQSLAGVVQRYLANITQTRGRSSLDIERSLQLSFTGDLCARGMRLHNNGFTCVQCRPGSFEQNGNCHICPIGAYQSEPGKTDCQSCRQDQVTEGLGSTSPRQCITPKLHNFDVIFVLDSSGSIGHGNWEKVKLFVRRFIETFVKAESGVAMGIITFNNQASLVLPLANHSSTALNRTIDNLAYTYGLTRTYDAMRMARDEFSKRGSGGRPALLFVMTDGKSTSDRGQPGFQLVRQQAQSLAAIGAHVVSIGVGWNVDNGELLAMASYPKEGNTLQLTSFDALISATTTIAVKALRGRCSISTRDILFAMESSSQVSDIRWAKTRVFLDEFLPRIVKLNDSRLGFATFGSNIKLTNKYQAYDSVENVLAQVDQLPRRRNENVNLGLAVFDSVNELLTEQHGSVSPVKTLLLFTRDKLDASILTKTYRYYDRDALRIINVVMTLRDLTQDVGAGDFEKDWYSVYTLAQTTDLLKQVKEDSLETNSCQRENVKVNSSNA